MEKKLFDRIRGVRMMKGLVLAYLVTIILLLLLSFLLYRYDLGEQKIQIGIIATYLLSTMAGGFAVGKMEKTKRFLWGIGLGILYFLLLAAISAGVYQNVQGGAKMGIACILCVVGGMIGGMLS